mgnify:CR=1 FL=1
MGGATSGEKRRWAWAAGCAFGGMALLLLLFSLTRPPAPATSPMPVRSAIRFDKPPKGSALSDQTTVLDPTPLFLPTDHNASQKKIDWPELGGAFQSYRFKPKLLFNDTNLNIDLPPPVAVPAKPANALTVDAPGALALGFGRPDAQIAPLPRRGASVEIVETRTGQPALSPRAMAQVEKLAAEAQPPGSQAWQPVSFLATVDAAGLFGPLAIEEPRSGVEDVDNYFQDFLERTLHLGERLAPGFYRISVGP